MWLVASALAADTIYSNSSGCSLVAEGTELYVRGCNLHVENGAGSTYTTNGLGNVVLGYGADSADTRTGSHNLVVGDFHSYTASGNLVAGYDNTVGGYAASVAGGRQNVASANYSAVLGGRQNNAGKVYATVAGGRSNVASGQYAQVAGGYANRASGTYTAIAGGDSSTHSESAGVGIGEYSDYLLVEDGDLVVDGANLVVRNGEGMTTGAENGKGNIIVGYNEGYGTEARDGSHNLVIGEFHDWTASAGVVAGAANVIDADYAVAIGYLNRASAVAAAAIAGMNSAATGMYAAVVGGFANAASGEGAVAVGGYNNTSSGPQSATVGGVYGAASADYASAFGGTGSTASEWGGVTSGETATIDDLEERVDDVETTLQWWEPTIWNAVDVFTWLSVDADDDLVVDGANLRVVNGEGTTDSENGEGNVIIGYGANTGGYARGGSHYLVVGDEHEYASNAGILYGYGNTSAAWGQLVGGVSNLADGAHAVIVNGYGHIASGAYSVIVAGANSYADSIGSAVVSGMENSTYGDYAAVLGGYDNDATGEYSTISAGKDNMASGAYSTVYGDHDEVAGDVFDYQP